MNQNEFEKNIKDLISHIGENAGREGLKDTPGRVFKAYEHLFSGYKENPENVLTVFDDEKYDEMIVCKNIEFYSMCEHHMLPFFGVAHIGYIPNGKIIGLSKLPRIVEIYSRRLQNQERLTSQVASCLKKLLDPKGVAVVMEAKHLCMMARGVEKQQSEVTTSSLNGQFKEYAHTRSEFMNLIR